VLLDLDSVPRSRGWDHTTVLCLQDDLVRADRGEVLAYVVRLLRHWGRERGRVVMLECLPPGDLHGWEELRRHVPRLELLTFDRLWHEGLPEGENVRWISTRFHPHLVAAAGGAPGVALALGGDYYRAKHDSLVDLGSSWSVVDDLAVPLPPLPHAGSSFRARLDELGRLKAAVADRSSTLPRGRSASPAREGRAG
jgi:hypothetical protein